eukprot:678671-Rhodomonas_salina.1
MPARTRKTGGSRSHAASHPVITARVGAQSTARSAEVVCARKGVWLTCTQQSDKLPPTSTMPLQEIRHADPDTIFDHILSSVREADLAV